MKFIDRQNRTRPARVGRFSILLATLTLVCPDGAARAQETHPFSIHDMLAMDRISDPQVSPDGQQVVFVLRKTDLEANRGRTDLWLVNIDGSNLRQLTTHPDGDSNPRWSHGGKTIYFLSTRSGSSQVWKIADDGGEAEQVTDQPLDIDTFVLSPDGKSVALAIEVFPDLSIEETKKRLDEENKKEATGKIYDRLFIRHWDTWEDGRRSHVFVIPLASGDATSEGAKEQGNSSSIQAPKHPAPIDIMKGMDADCPSKPFGGPEEFTFTPNSKAIVFTARDVGREEAWSTDFDLYLVPADGSARPQCITEANRAWDTAPSFSPDGKTLAYLAMSRPGYEADTFGVILQPWPEGPPRAIQAYDSIGSVNWLDNDTLLTTSGFRGQQCLKADRIPEPSPPGGMAALQSTILVQKGTVAAVSAAGGTILYGLDDLKSPVELYTIKPDGSAMKQITNINADKLAATRMGDFEQFTFNGWNDEIVHAYVVKPVDFDANKKYPVAFLIHGGPQGSFGNHFHYRWNPQAYAGAGYAAVMIDFHGSTGYGREFCDSIRGDWGGKPLEDLQRGLAAALEKYPWMDRDRVAALGASYGGYMINWIAGNWRRPPADSLSLPDFRCLVNHDGNLDEQMAYFDTEELWFPEWDHLGNPWDNPENYQKHNPINYVKNWNTPMLVIHGGRDYRVVDTHGMSTFTALQRRGIPSKFLYFPDENHWVLKPANSILWHETVLGWLNQWTE